MSEKSYGALTWKINLILQKKITSDPLNEVFQAKTFAALTDLKLDFEMKYFQCSEKFHCIFLLSNLYSLPCAISDYTNIIVYNYVKQ